MEEDTIILTQHIRNPENNNDWIAVNEIKKENNNLNIYWNGYLNTENAIVEKNIANRAVTTKKIKGFTPDRIGFVKKDKKIEIIAEEENDSPHIDHLLYIHFNVDIPEVNSDSLETYEWDNIFN